MALVFLSLVWCVGYLTRKIGFGYSGGVGFCSIFALGSLACLGVATAQGDEVGIWLWSVEAALFGGCAFGFRGLLWLRSGRRGGARGRYQAGAMSALQQTGGGGLDDVPALRGSAGCRGSAARRSVGCGAGRSGRCGPRTKPGGRCGRRGREPWQDATAWSEPGGRLVDRRVSCPSLPRGPLTKETRAPAKASPAATSMAVR